MIELSDSRRSLRQERRDEVGAVQAESALEGKRAGAGQPVEGMTRVESQLFILAALRRGKRDLSKVTQRVLG